MKYLDFRIFQSRLGFSINQTEHIMELVNEWLTGIKFIKFDTPFYANSAYDKYILVGVPIPVEVP